MNTVLNMLKIDLGINHTMRDEYFTELLNSCQAELISKGVTLDLAKPEDIMLLSDYAAWVYRKRTEDVPMAQNLTCRIRNRKVKGRATIV
ncbi:MAG: hypothetical protein RSF82_11100 [Angelakisella sp.]